MDNNFSQKFNQIYEEIQSRKQKFNSDDFYYILDNSIILWCQKLNIEWLTPSILEGQKRYKIESLLDYLWKDLNIQKDPSMFSIFSKNTEENKLFNLVKVIFKKIKIHSDVDINFIISLGFIITAVAYSIYLLNQHQLQQPAYPIKSNVSPSPSQLPSSTSSVPSSTPVQPKTKYLLILVISATQTALIDSLKDKRKIEYGDCEKLYKATQYLCQNKETYLKYKWDNLEQYIVQPGVESEYDIHLIKIELNQENKNFEKDVNQLDKYDAFFELVGLADQVEISPQLQMEAYGNFDVYHR
ncbi:hypothetical protein [Aphanothece hegewaldii]|nr:hypothetical protein [Aphanothece hegewaldii]